MGEQRTEQRSRRHEPRDDRSWPRWAPYFSGTAVLAILVAVVLVTADAARESPARAGVVAGVFVVEALLAGWVMWHGAQAAIEGCDKPLRTSMLLLGVLVLGIVGFSIDAPTGWAGFGGWFAGLFAANLAAQRSARRNRPVVEALEREHAEEDRDHDARREDQDLRHPPTGRADLGRLLRYRAAKERSTVLAWLVAGPVVLGVAALVRAAMPVLMVIGIVALVFGCWALRRWVGAWLADRDYRAAATEPRRAFVVLVHDPAPRMVRPLLAIWAQRPSSSGGAFPKADAVYRCDEEVDELKSFQGSAVVHEAWVDTGPRRRSKPRWVAANDGIALPQRRSFLGRWYVGNLLRAERPDPPDRLEIRAPHPSQDPVDQLTRLETSFAKSVVWRVAGLAATWAVMAVLIARAR